MRIELEGQRFALAGAFRLSKSRAKLTERLVAAGAKVSKDVSSRTTVAVIGQSAWTTNAETVARERGLPVLTEAQALKLLEDGFIELEDEERSGASIDALVAEARGLLDASSDTLWAELQELVTRCDPEQVSELVDYLEGRLAHEGHDALERVVPPSWLTRALEGKEPLGARLANTLAMGSLRLTNANLIALIGSPLFENVKDLDLSTRGTCPSGKTLSALANAPMTPSLRRLRVPAIRPVHARALAKITRFDALRHLDVPCGDDGISNEIMNILSKSDWLGRLDELTIRAYKLPIELDLSWMTSLERVTLSLGTAFLDHLPMRVVLTPNVSTLAITGHVHAVVPDDVRRLLSTRYVSIGCLDLSGLAAQPRLSTDVGYSNRTSTLEEVFLRYLPSSSLGRSFASIRLGRWFSESLAADFEASGIEVVDRSERDA